MSGFSPIQQDLSGKFGCLVLSGQETRMPSPVEPYLNCQIMNTIFSVCLRAVDNICTLGCGGCLETIFLDKKLPSTTLTSEMYRNSL